MTTALSHSIVTFGPVEENARVQLDRCLTVGGAEAKGVLCADHHKGYSMPIGGVLASQSVVQPAGVGYDIACGNYAVRTNILAKDIDTARIMDEIWKVISFGVGRKNNEYVEHAIVEEIAQSPVLMQRSLAHMAQQQLGTVGSGNHYVDLFEDRTNGSLWIGVHFGSRGLGHKTATHFLNLAAQEYGDGHYADNMDASPVAIPLGSAMADDYLAAMQIAGRYAYAGREWVVERVMAILGTSANFHVHNHHNFAWFEQHGGEQWLVVRKGATPANPGQLGFIGASMGEDAVIVRGIDSALSASALYSTVHGAGRVMGRRQAAGKTRVKRKWCCLDYRKCDFKGAAGGFRPGPNGETPRCPNCGHKLRLQEVEEVITPGRVDYAAWQTKLKAQGIELRGGGADEAPECYKRLPDVLGHHAGTIEVLHTLRPIGVAMAGREVVDPYKD